MKKKNLVLISILLIACFSLSAKQISFKADSTYAKLENKDRMITLKGHAEVVSDGFVLESDSISIEGEKSDFIFCEGNVKVTEEEQKLSLFTQRLNFYRDKELLNIDNWVYIEDEKNNLIATCGSLLYYQKTGLMRLSLDVNIYKNTKDGLMVCKAQILEFDREKEELILKGKAKVELDNNEYNASIIKVDLKTNNITLDGNISAIVES